MYAITAATKTVGLLGNPVTHSFSPVMHNAAFQAHGLEFVYLAWEISPVGLEQALKGIKALGFRGVNVTIPYKEQVLPWLDSLSVEATIIGAVNTIVVEGSKLYGYNTDGAGFLRSLAEDAGVTPRGKSIMILGTGGASRAVAVTLALNGASRIYLVNRTINRAVGLAALLKHHVHQCQVYPVSLEEEQLSPLLKDMEIIIHASPVGMYPHVMDKPYLNPELINPKTLVCDLVYNPLETVFLRGAATRGCRTLSGLGMLVYQGALAFQLWTGREAPVAKMRQAISECLVPGV